MPSYTESVFAEQPIFLQSRSYDAKHDRKALTDILSPGVVAAGDFAVTLTAGLGVSIAGGIAYILGQNVADQGTYRQHSSGAIALNVGAADAVNPRLDQVIIRIMDSDADASGSYEGRIEIIPGLATAGATLINRNGAKDLTTLLENSKSVLLLEDVLVLANQINLTGASIADRRVFAKIGNGSAGLAAHEANHLPTGSDPLPWTTIHGSSTLALQPVAAAANAGYLWLVTDVNGGTLYRSNGAAWIKAALGATEAGSSSVLASAPVLETGILGQYRAGRPLVLTDFTTLLGLTAPVGLYNLGTVNDISGNGRTLTNKGAVTFGAGISGNAAEAAQFTGSTAQALYFVDIGAGDPFRIAYGSFGCWFKTSKKAQTMALVTKWNENGVNKRAWRLDISSDVVELAISTDGTFSGATYKNTPGSTVVTDGRWHHAVVTYDGTIACVYVDGVLDGTSTFAGSFFATDAPFNIGGMRADAGTVADLPFYGLIDETFVTPDVLTLAQIRMLYAMKFAHGSAITPTGANLNIRRRKKGGAFVIGDFSTQPKHLYNFTAAALIDAGSLNNALTNNNAAVAVPGADGALGNAFNFVAASSQSLSVTDTGLPAGTTARSFGAWVKAFISTTADLGVMAYGTNTAGNGLRLLIVQNTGVIRLNDYSTSLSSPFLIADGLWHFVVVILDNAAVDGLKRKLFVDGKLIIADTTFNSTTLGGAGAFKIGADLSAQYMNGSIDGVFITDYAMSSDEQASLYAKGSLALMPSPKNEGDHIEGMDATNLYMIADTLESQHQLDLVVRA